MIAKRLNFLKPSMTLQISAKARKLSARGVSVIDFSVGQPDFPTPENAKEAGKAAIDENFTRYTPADGIFELKNAILNYLMEDSHLDYRPNQVIVSPGAKASIYLALAAILDRDDEVIIPAPYWVTYPEQVRLLNGRPVILETSESDGFILSPDKLKRHITQRSRVLILNNPSNPTGAAYPPDILKALVTTAVEHGLTVIADEIYSRIIFDDFPFTRAAAVAPEVADHVITIDGVSKTYAMTGWRIGFAVGPQAVIETMKRIQGHLTSNPCSVSQKAAAAAFNGNQAEVERRRRIFQERRDLLLEGLNAIPGIHCFKPQGAFYLFPNISRYFNMSDGTYDIYDSMDMATYLLEKAHVAVVPGDAFGAADHIRISFAVSMDDIREGLKRITGALGDLGRL